MLRVSGNDVLLQVYVQPGAKNTACVGLHDGRLKIRLSAQPVEGQANQALCEWLAKHFCRPKRSVGVLKGLQTRLKQVQFQAAAPQFEQMNQMLAQLLESGA